MTNYVTQSKYTTMDKTKIKDMLARLPDNKRWTF